MKNGSYWDNKSAGGSKQLFSAKCAEEVEHETPLLLQTLRAQTQISQSAAARRWPDLQKENRRTEKSTTICISARWLKVITTTRMHWQV
jgi:hypothetical protein